MSLGQDFLAALDNEQEKAVTLKSNGIVAAGAGSGKTKVLASRYVWLVIEEKLKPEEILTLTFTNKAVSEMYSRIYQYLMKQADERARAAIENFHKARISTLDSFSAAIARSAAARYGISPDFTSDDARLRDIAREASLRFVLDNREAPAIRQLLVDHKIKVIADEIFSQVVLKHSSVSSPINLDDILEVQKKALLEVWREKTKEADTIAAYMIDNLHTLAEQKKSIGFTKSLEAVLLENPLPPAPDLKALLEAGAAEIRQQIKKYIVYYSAIVSIRAPSNYVEVYAALVENFRLLKGKGGDGLYGKLESIANYSLNFSLCSGVFGLIKKFQDEFNTKKRETGFLSFKDIAQLAVDALKDHPDIRKAYKDSLRMIMIDEFQDNNALQRDLIYLLAENPGRTAKGIPAPHELEQNRLFFVGDEKQSIYRFRGADVSVFRSLDRELEKASSIGLVHNYRSQPSLIAVFNRIFGGDDGVFLLPGCGVPEYEAVYRQIQPPKDGEKAESRKEETPLAHFCFLNGEDLSRDNIEGIKSQDLEAAFIAEKIRDMVVNKAVVLKRNDNEKKWQACEYKDFAVLERSYTHQSSLEKYFREFGVPFITDRPAGLFSEAPIMDLRAYLRLIVYPDDRISYAAIIRSPFVRLGDLSLAVCMLARNTEPFAEENEVLVPEEDLVLYRRAREQYRTLCEASRTLSITELVTKLWFDEGYRYETLWTESAQVYENLFDLFFSMASDADSRGKSLAEFIDYLDDVMNREEKPDDKDIPGEGESGVRIMSIHKSKGLEFPVVFIYDCAHSGNFRRSSGLLGFHDEYGLILNVPQAEELPGGGNYFRDVLKAEEETKDIAELRRLLYVAMTRAECRLYLTFTLPPRTKDEKKEWDLIVDTAASDGEEVFDEEIIRRRLVQMNEKSDKRNTFLKLLSGVLSACPKSHCAVETIPVLTRAEISKHAAIMGRAVSRSSGQNQREAALAAVSFYENAEILPEGKAGPASLDASKLRYKAQKLPIEPLADAVLDPVLDVLLEKTGLTPADFGSFVHSVMEGRLNQQPCHAPFKIYSRTGDDKVIVQLTEKAEAMADNFLASELGNRWAASSRRESEFPVITAVIIEEKPITIMGQIDLLFEEDSEVVVVDFKTDRIENPEDHYGQLAAYYRAAFDIFAKPVSVWLCYLRSGNLVNVTENVKNLPLEELAAAALSG